MTKQPKGWILGEFQSPIDGRFCVAILTPKTANRKTGDMMQVWILRQDVHPVDAVNLGLDESICGNCQHRKSIYTGHRTCYVNVGQAPASVWWAYHRGIYQPDFLWEDRKYLKGRHVRWGAYGDPAIIPPHIVDPINYYAAGWTGYTHQWMQPFAQEYKKIFMASVDSYLEQKVAMDEGWKTFRVVPKGIKGIGHQCPETVENSSAQCVTCNLCNGNKTDIWITAHGPGKKHFGPIIQENKEVSCV